MRFFPLLVSHLGLVRVQELGNDFLAGCTDLTAIDLSSMQALQVIGNGAFSGCT